MRNLATLNELWDGRSISTDRRSSESYVVRGARLTVALQVQEATLRSFFERSGGLARGTGFMSRFLVAWPESTQGFRIFNEAPQSWLALDAFNQRIAEILHLPVPINKDGSLSPAELRLTPQAKASWIAFHNLVESELVSGGELQDVRNVASKSADNVATLATLFHVFEHGADGALGAEAVESASRIVAWRT
jgi:putative DNA primase/helicase